MRFRIGSWGVLIDWISPAELRELRAELEERRAEDSGDRFWAFAVDREPGYLYVRLFGVQISAFR